jgi:hypothetical protein
MMDSKADAAAQGSNEGYGDSQSSGGYEAPAQAQPNNYGNQGSQAPQQQYGQQQQQQQSYGSQQNNSYGNQQQAQPQQNYQRQEMPSAQAIPEIDIDEDEIPF